MGVAIRGMLANVEAGLFFKFQFNPHEIKSEKPVHYNIVSPAGWDRPIIQYSHNGERTIEFDVVGDATEGSQGTFQMPRPYGVRDMIAVLESFKLPQDDGFFPDLKRRRFTQPPNCYFIYGLKWAKCKLLDAPVRELLFTRDTLTPQRFFTTIKLIVVEDGDLYALESYQRALLAKIGSIFDAVPLRTV